MGRISPEQVAFSMLLTLALVSLLGMLWAWVWALGQIWRGLPILASDRARPLERAPWGGLTILALVFLYLGVNMTVFRVYAAATGRHIPRLAEAAANQGGARKLAEPIDQPKNVEKAPPPPKEAAADGNHKDVKPGTQASEP